MTQLTVAYTKGPQCEFHARRENCLRRLFRSTEMDTKQVTAVVDPQNGCLKTNQVIRSNLKSWPFLGRPTWWPTKSSDLFGQSPRWEVRMGPTNQPDESWARRNRKAWRSLKLMKSTATSENGWVVFGWSWGSVFGGVKGNAQGKPSFVAFFWGFPTRRHTCIDCGLHSLTSKNPTICIGEAKRQWGSK